MAHKFRIGDRVVGVFEFDSNTNYIGVQGTVMREKGTSYDTIGVVFDEHINGHEGDNSWYRRCEHGRGWNLYPACVRYLGRRVNPDTADLGTGGKVEAPPSITLTWPVGLGSYDDAVMYSTLPRVPPPIEVTREAAADEFRALVARFVTEPAPTRLHDVTFDVAPGTTVTVGSTFDLSVLDGFLRSTK